MCAEYDGMCNKIPLHLLLQRLAAYHKWIANWSVIGGRKNLPIVSGWLQATSALQLLIHEALVEHKFTFLLTGRFNQDAVEVSAIFCIISTIYIAYMYFILESQSMTECDSIELGHEIHWRILHNI